MKIDTTKIPNFDTLPSEAQAAILAMEFDDAPDMSQFVAKSVFDKKASEAAELGKQLKAKMSQEEQEQAKAAETLKSMQDELDTLRREKTITEYTKRWMGVGYDENLATATAQAMFSGDLDTVFKNHSKFLSDREKALKAELLKDTPTPPAGDGGKGVTREDVSKMSLTERAKFAKENPEQYKTFYGGN